MKVYVGKGMNLVVGPHGQFGLYQAISTCDDDKSWKQLVRNNGVGERRIMEFHKSGQEWL